jgi:hypothetical protein
MVTNKISVDKLTVASILQIADSYMVTVWIVMFLTDVSYVVSVMADLKLCIIICLFASFFIPFFYLLGVCMCFFTVLLFICLLMDSFCSNYRGYVIHLCRASKNVYTL